MFQMDVEGRLEEEPEQDEGVAVMVFGSDLQSGWNGGEIKYGYD